MSVKTTRRFDKYLSLFNNPAGDDRITLLLGELEDAAKIAKNLRGPTSKDYLPADIVLTANSVGLHCGNFYNKGTCVADTDTHDEWKDYMITFAMRLAGTYSKEQKNLELIKQLKKDGDSTDAFILVLLSKIAVFKIKSIDDDKDFLANFSDLPNITGYVFRSSLFSDIIVPLTDTTVYPDIGAFSTTVQKLMDTTAPFPTATTSRTSIQSELRTTMYSTTSSFISYKPEWDLLWNDLNIWNAGASPVSQIAQATTTKDNRDPDDVSFVYLKTIKPFYLKHVSDNQKKDFGYNYDKYLKNKLFAAQDASIPVDTQASSFFAEDIIDPKNVGYKRYADGRLTIIENGKEVRVDMNSDKYKALSHNDKCFGTGFTGNTGVSGESCGDYLRDCLSGKDVTKCIGFLKKPDFWVQAEKEVDNMLPSIALKTLESFEFQTYTIKDDTMKMELKKVITTNEWLKTLEKMTHTTPTKISTADYIAIAANTKLIGYLNLLVKKVNQNPTLLNPSIINVKSDEQKRYNTKVFSGSVLGTMGLQPRVPSSNLGSGTFLRLGDMVNKSQSSTQGILNLLLSSRIPYNLSGGSSQIDDLEKRLVTETKQTWPVFKKHYEQLLIAFQSMNKDITSKDKEEIDKLINRLKDSEIKLMQIMLMSEKYKDLIQIHGEKDGQTMLTIDHLKQFVDQRNKYFTRVANKQNNLLSVISLLADSLQKVAPTTTEPESEPKREALVLSTLTG